MWKGPPCRNRASSGVPPSENPSGEAGDRSLTPPRQSEVQAVGAPWEAATSHHRGFLPRESPGLVVERGGQCS